MALGFFFLKNFIFEEFHFGRIAPFLNPKKGMDDAPDP
jgi:hypothetical protein